MHSSRERSARRRKTASSYFQNTSNSWTKAANVLLLSIIASSVIYLVSTHVLISRRSKVVEEDAYGAIAKTPSSFYATEDDQDDPRSKVNKEPRELDSTSQEVPLRCRGAPPEVDLAYWKNTPTDKAYESPWGESARQAKARGKPQYVSFEPDHGGFNNIRMAMETMVVFAKTTGRTLVMPPAQKFYLLKTPASEFGDMFPVEAFSEYMDVVSTEEFLQREAITGRLGNGKRPPNNKTSDLQKEVLDTYLREVADMVPHWDPMFNAVIFGASPDEPEIPEDEASQKWLRDFLTNKRTPLWYSKEMQEARLIHFRCSREIDLSHKNPTRAVTEYRLLTHFYTFIGFSDPVVAAYHRRLVRDLVHFREELFCIASQIVARLREAGGGHPGTWSGWHGEGGGLEGSGGWDGDQLTGSLSETANERGAGMRRAGFSTFHIRRGDFQYPRMKPEASVIVQATEKIRCPGEVLFIATDERDKSFFDAFTKDHRVFFLSDFQHFLEDIDPSYYLMIDTIVASQGRAFVGTWRSTFTGYITRLRGYYGFPTEFSWYFWNEVRQSYEAFSLAEDTTPRSPFFMREWPDAWENIQRPVGG